MKFALLWQLKNEKMADYCGFAGVFVSKRAFFCKKMPQSGAVVCYALSFFGKLYEFGAMC